MIYPIIEELRSNNSRIFKEQLLQREENNELLERVIEMTLNPRKNYYIKKLITRNKEIVSPIDLNTALNTLDEKIVSREVTGHAAHELVNELLDGLTSDDGEVLRLIIGRDLKCGVSTSTANKTWPNLVPEQPYQRCALLKDMKKDKIKWSEGLLSQEKLDGMFANFDIKAIGGSDVMSRNGSMFPPEFFSHITSSLNNSGGSGFQFHGELLVEDMENETVLAREIGNGMLNSILQQGSLNTAKYRIIFVVWDMVPLIDVYQMKKTTKPYSERLAGLTDLLKRANSDDIKLVETRVVYSMKEALAHYVEKISTGGEGTILKIPTTLWKDGNSTEMFKFKIDAECDLEIVGFNAGNGKNAKTFGSVECRSLCGLLEVNVSGFSDKEREDMNADRGYFMNKIMAVTFNDIMHSEGKKSSLFLPRKKEIRLDKTEADTLEKIQEIFDSILNNFTTEE